jgi:outer membrane protein assembly factor BamB
MQSMSLPLSCRLSLVAALAGCADEAQQAPAAATPPELAAASWPDYRGDAALTGVAAGNLGDRFALRWRFATGGPIVSSPVIADGRVFIGSADQNVYALDLATGTRCWSFATGDAIDAPPLVVGNRVYIGSADFWFYALDATDGALAWKHETGDKVLGSANRVRTADGVDRILVGSYDYRLYCFAAASGELLWTYATENYVNGAPAILGECAVFGGCDAVLHVVAVTTGVAIAKVALGDGCHVAGSVALAAGKAYFGHYGNEFDCVDLATGEFVWTYPGSQPFFAAPAIGAEHVLFGGRDKRLHCVRRADGTPLWTFPTTRKVDASPVLCGDKVVFGSADGRLYVVALADGHELWRYEIGQSILSSPAVAGGWMVVGSNDGCLYAFAPAGGR